MPRPAVYSAFLVYEYQRIGIQGRIVVALAADVNQGRSVLPLQLFEERLCKLTWHGSIL
jgi:hypothetical protein